MTTHPVPSDFETRTNATYDALMWALSRPGLIRHMPETGQAGVIEALLDRECKAHCADPALASSVARTGAALVASDHADHLFFDSLPDADTLEQINLGSDLYPEIGATLVCNAVLGRACIFVSLVRAATDLSMCRSRGFLMGFGKIGRA